MPYETRRSAQCPKSRPIGVFKVGDRSKPLGCHESEEAAQRQIAAIEANEERQDT